HGERIDSLYLYHSNLCTKPHLHSRVLLHSFYSLLDNLPVHRPRRRRGGYCRYNSPIGSENAQTTIESETRENILRNWIVRDSQWTDQAQHREASRCLLDNVMDD